jgi:hypothetical protein
MSANPMFACKAESLRRASIILVNNRVPRADAQCARCGGMIEKGYVRELQTDLVYCDTQCFTGRAKMLLSAFETRARKVS